MTRLPFIERRGRPERGVVRIAGLTLFSFFALAGVSDAEIPRRPADRQFLHDLAGTIGDADEQKIRVLQEQVFNQVSVPIVVVTVSRMRDYDPGAPSIESFARRWFDAWAIGSQQKNDGILVIISTGDRKGRIELGAIWARRFDGYCQRVMDNDMIPDFKAGNYGAGLVVGIEKLAKMAKAGAQSEPPGPELGERFKNITGFVNQNNPIAEKGGPGILLLMIVAGLGCFVAAYFLPDYRKALLIAGFVLIGLAVLWHVVLVILAIVLRGRGGGSSGGGFGGGSSGGGGASGGW